MSKATNGKRQGGSVQRVLSGVEMIAAERHRQTVGEGWTSEHDDEHVRGEMAAAAAVYAAPVEIYRDATAEEIVEEDKSQFNYIRDRDNHYWTFRRVWPWDKSDLKRRNRMRALVKAGALIAAEIDRLQRKATKAR